MVHAQQEIGVGFKLLPTCEVIDGFHRRGENQNWHAITVPHIDTPVKLEMARLAVNFARRNVGSEELKQRITFLRNAGISTDEIATKTGISKRTIAKYTPQELKDQSKVAAGKLGGKKTAEKAEISAARVHQTVTTSDTEGEKVPP